MAKLARTILVAAVMVAAVAVYAGVAAGHGSGNGSGNRTEDHHGKQGDRHGAKHRGRHHGRHLGNALVEASLAPSQPGDPTFHGVAPGAAPWVLDRGKVELKVKGKLELRVRGLVIPGAPGNGTPGPVTTISASLFCGADSETAPAATSDTVPISQDGNARIEDDSFTVPDTCLAPVILVHPNGDLTHYIAVDGWRSA